MARLAVNQVLTRRPRTISQRSTGRSAHPLRIFDGIAVAEVPSAYRNDRRSDPLSRVVRRGELQDTTAGGRSNTTSNGSVHNRHDSIVRNG
jgi:hypothetical protein